MYSVHVYIHEQVGGDFFDTVLPLMNEFGRVSICGCISQYNLEEQQEGELCTMDVYNYMINVVKYIDVGMPHLPL